MALRLPKWHKYRTGQISQPTKKHGHSHYTLVWLANVISWAWPNNLDTLSFLTHWGRVTHICVNKLAIIGSDNGLSPGWRQAIIWTNTGILLIWTLGPNFSEISREIHAFSFKKMHFCEMASILSQPQCVNNKIQECLVGCITSWDVT